MQNNSIIIDVGANTGGFSLEIARRNSNLRIYAIEPEPELVTQLISSSETLDTPNHIVCNFAVSDKDTTSSFYVSHKGDWGTSSLLPFDNEHIQHDPYWSTRSDLVHTNVINVITKRLDTFLNDVKYNEIKFIKIDAQGYDLIALKSLGSHIHRVQAGMMEVVGIASSALYLNEQDDLRSTLNYLADNGFVVYGIKPNDHGANEYNLFFHRPDVDIKLLEVELKLKNLIYYDGKDFWHYPSDKLQNIEVQLHSLQENIKQLVAERNSLLLAYSDLQENANQLVVERDSLQIAYDNLKNKLIIRLLRWSKRMIWKINSIIKWLWNGK